jgi:putative oxidoreductase
MQGLQIIGRLFTFSTRCGDYLQSLALLALRITVVKAFFLSGLTKIQSWENTLLLFQHEYQVPGLNYQIAAILGTATEITIPIFIALGLGARLPALILFVFNIVAVYSYAHALTPAGFEDHIAWGVSLLALMAFGPGKLSLDYLLVQKDT